jgi:hypothetical protein
MYLKAGKWPAISPGDYIHSHIAALVSRHWMKKRVREKIEFHVEFRVHNG